MLNNQNERELCYAVRVTDITPIEGADKVELAHINGWHIMVKKGDYKVGDLAIYFEIDSLLPITNPAFDFMAKYKYKVKTQRYMRGTVLSQGLLMRPDELGLKDVKEGDFLTKELGVTYYEAEDNTRKASSKELIAMKVAKRMDFWKKRHKFLSRFKFICELRRKLFEKQIEGTQKKKKTNWPYWVKKTDEDRCLGADTKITTEVGLLRIGDIVSKRIPVRVKSYNEVTGEIEYKEIVDYQFYPQDVGFYEIKTPFSVGSNRRFKSIRCTSDHKFYIGNNTYKKTSELRCGDTVYASAYTYKNPEILEFLYGNILGDGHLYREGGLIRFTFSQGESHKEYVDTLFNAYSGGHYITELNGFNRKKLVYKFGLINTALLSVSINECEMFHGGKWSLTPKFCDKLTWKSLATWYMDDGGMNPGTSRPSAHLHTEGYSHEEQLLLIDTLRKNFGIDAAINHNHKYEYLRINCDSSEKFWEKIAPYIIPCMQYKLPEKYRNNQDYLGSLRYTFGEVLLPTQIKDIKYIHRYMCSYDIEVKDNHNFFAGGILTHNCQNLPQLFTEPLNETHWISTEKIDGTSTTFTMLQAKKKKRHAVICSRNVVFDTPQADEKNYYKDTDGNVYAEMFEKYDINAVLNYILDKHPEYEFITIQGETYGGTIQKRKYCNEHRLAIFNIIFKTKGLKPIRLNPIEMHDCVNQINKELQTENKLECVPIICEDFILPTTCEMLLEYADDASEIDGGMREGLVFRSRDGKLSFKAVSNKFLEKYHG